jgi:hypothetical protein
MWETSAAVLAQQLFQHAHLTELNHLLFRCNDEEKDISG